MAITDYGITAVGFACGCSDETGMPKFCGRNPEHTMHACGCMNLGGNFIQCTRHYCRPFIIIGILIILIIAAIVA